MEEENIPQELLAEKVNFWKDTLKSIFWSLFILVVAFLFFEYGLSLMSKPSTFLFIIGIAIIAICVTASFGVLDYHIFKIRNMYKIKKIQENIEETKNEQKYETNNA